MVSRRTSHSFATIFPILDVVEQQNSTIRLVVPPYGGEPVVDGDPVEGISLTTGVVGPYGLTEAILPGTTPPLNP